MKNDLTQKTLYLFCTFLLFAAAKAFSQGQFSTNLIMPVAEIEQKLQTGEFSIYKFGDARFDGDITKRVILQFDDDKLLQVKWRRAINGADVFNNRPRYELAAYAIQKLFLDEDEYVVPPTCARGWPLKKYRKYDSAVDATFTKPPIVFFVLQCWLENVALAEIHDKARFKKDSLYARHFANMNIFSYLIYHSDSNRGNALISTLPDQPRVFIVDNGVAFDSEPSNRGTKWREIRVNRLPRKTIERLKSITREQLDQTLAVVAEYKIENGGLTPVEFSENFNSKAGVRRKKNRLQMGLNRLEIKNVHSRLKDLLKRVEKGKFELF